MFGETIKKEMQKLVRKLCARKSRHGAQGTTQCSRILRSIGDCKLKNEEILKETREVKIPLTTQQKKKLFSDKG